MELAAIARVLRRHHLVALLGVLPALVAGGLAAGRLGAHGLRPALPDGGAGSVRVLLEARTSPPVDLDPRASDSVAVRARLIGDLLATPGGRRLVDARLQADPASVAVVPPDTGTDGVAVPIPIALQGAVAAAARSPEILTVEADGQVPVLTLKAVAPTRARAEALLVAGRAAVEALVADAAWPGTGLQAIELGPPATRAVAAPSGVAKGLLAGGLVLGLWCAAIVLAGGARRRPGSGPGPAPGTPSWLDPRAA